MDASSIATIAITVIVSMLAGGVGLALFVGKAIHDVANASALTPSSSSSSRQGELDLVEASEAPKAALDEARDALEAFRTASKRAAEGGRLPTPPAAGASFYGHPDAPQSPGTAVFGPYRPKSSCKPCAAVRRLLGLKSS